MLEESRSEAANTEVVMLQAGQTDNQVRPMVFESGVSVSGKRFFIGNSIFYS